jgi:hypothetical protein
MNEYGLDSRYFKEKLGQLVRDANNYTPQEMSNALSGLKEVADQQQRKVAMKKNGVL